MELGEGRALMGEERGEIVQSAEFAEVEMAGERERVTKLPPPPATTTQVSVEYGATLPPCTVTRVPPEERRRGGLTVDTSMSG